MSFASSWKKNTGLFRLAILSNIEYRLNFFVDVIGQPFINALIELCLWFAVFKAVGRPTIAGFGQEFYLSYVIWSAFINRITANWMYEFRMVDEIDSGTVNSVLVRPISFFQYYWSQFFGYKFATTAFSVFIPMLAVAIFSLPTRFERIPITMVFVFYYLLFAFTMSYCVACFAFFLNRIHSFTAAKNLFLWLLSGELFPLDLAPEPFKSILIHLPFSGACYTPVGYMTGRFGTEVLARGFVSVTFGILIFAAIGRVLWVTGLKRYTGTGA